MKRLIRIFPYCIVLGIMTFSNCDDTEQEVKPQIGFTVPSSSVNEGEKVTVSFTIPLPNGVAPIISLSGTAKETDDYTYAVTPAGLEFTVKADKVKEPDETIVITLTGFTGNAVLGANKSHTITIKEPILPVVEFASIASEASEGGNHTVAFKTPLPVDVIPTISVKGTAEEGTDYSYTINPTGILFSVLDDGLYDPAETIRITLTGVTDNAELGKDSVHTITINEPPLVVEFLSASSSIAEGTEATVAFNMLLPEGVLPTVSISGTATETTDYTYSVSSQGVTLITINDGLYDPNETIVITLTGITGNAVLGSIKTHTVTVTETPLVVEFASSASSAVEGDEVTVAFNMTLPTGVTPSFSFSGSAAQGADFTYIVTSSAIIVSILDDAQYDPDETLQITLTALTGNAEIGSVKTHTISITDVPLDVEFVTTSSSIQEGQGGSIAFNITLPPEVIPTISLGGTATQGTDYTYSITQQGISITTLADGLYDPSETIILTLTGVSGNAVLGANTVHTVTITEPQLVVEFVQSSSSTGEGENHAILFNMSLPDGVIPSFSLGGTASLNTDYTYNLTSAGIEFIVLDDGLYDPNETIIVTLTAISGNAVLGANKVHTITITEPPLVVDFAATSSSVLEGEEGTVAFNMVLPPGVNPTISLGGTATQGSDYTYTVTQSGIVFTINSDGAYDPDETIIITLTGISGNAVLGPNKVHTITITEIPLVVEFASTSSSVSEGNGVTALFTSTLPAGVTPTVSISGTASQGSDYTYSVTQSGVTVTTIDDGLYDPNETIIITLTGVSGNAGLGTNNTHTVTITEPQLVVEFASSSSAAPENGNHIVNYTITLPDEVVPTISLSGTASQGTDYTYAVTPAGIEFTLIDDGLYDPNETIVITLTDVTGNAIIGTAKTHTITITEPPLVVEFQSSTSSMAEGSTYLVGYNMTLPAGVTPTISLSGTATPGSDYSYSITQSGISITTSDDGLYDPNETIIITLTGISGNAVLGNNKVHTVTVTEPPLVVQFASSSSAVPEGAGSSIAFTFPLPVEVVPTISFGGTATLGSDYTYSMTQSGIIVTVLEDAVFDPDETIILTMTAVSGNAVLGATKVHTITTTETPLVVEFVTTSSSLGEGNSNTVSFNLILPGSVVPSISLGGTATQGADYSYSITQNGILISTINDGFYDPNETIIITLTGITGNAELGTVLTHTVTITEPPLVVEFTSSSVSVPEGSNTTASFTISLPPEVVPSFSLGGTATQGTDYSYSLTQNGIEINSVADGIYDPNETIIITLTGVSGNAVLGSIISHTITLTEPPLVVEFVSSSSSVEEGDGRIIAYNMTLPAGVTPTISLGGTATQGTDYTYAITQSGIQISTSADGLYDPNETIIITLTGVSGNAILGSIISHTLTLTEPPLVVEFVSNSSTLAEGDGSTIPFNMVLPAGVTPTLSLGGTATPGTDYTYSITQSGILISTSADGVYDPDESIIITLTGISGNAVLGSVTTHTINLTEPPLVVEFTSSSSALAEGDNTTVLFNLNLPAEVVPAVSLGGTATQGTDYTYSITQNGVVITSVADGIYDPNETIVITLTGVSGNAVLGTTLSHTLTLTEPPLVVEFASTSSALAEGEGGTVAFTFALPDGVTPTVSLSGTASQGSDYSYSLTQSGIIITTVDDGLYDPNETIVITLTGVSGNAVLGSTITHTITLTEPPLVVEFASGTTTLAEGDGSTVLYTFVLPTGVTPTISLGGTATQGTDYTYSITQAGIVITTSADGLYDPNETIIITLTGVSGNAILGSQITHTLTLTEPPLIVEFASGSSTLAEGDGGTIAYNMTLPDGVTPTVSVSGTATLGSDYSYSISQSGIVLTTSADGLYDPNETIIITLTGITGNAELGTILSHTVTLTEPPLIVEFASNSSSMAEGEGGTIPYTFTLPDGVTPSITLGGTATEGTDYTYSITQSGIVINTVADGLYDPNETIVITLTSVTGNAELGTTITHTITLTEPPLVVEFATVSTVTLEGDIVSVLFNMTLPDAVIPTITLGGSATEGLDYTYTVTSDGIVFATTDDGLYDPNETIIITLTSVTGNAVIGSSSGHAVIIRETPLIVEFTAETSALAEGSGTSIAFNQTLPAEVVPTITLGGTATPAEDYTYSITDSGIIVTAIDDGLYDPNETIIFTITEVTGNAEPGTVITHTLTLTELPLVVEFSSASSTISEGTSGLVTFTLTLPPEVIPTFTLEGTATEGIDYTYSVTTSAIEFNILEEWRYDPDETIIITLTGVSGNAELGTNLAHTITIADSPGHVVEFAADNSVVAEGQTLTVAYTSDLPDGVVPVITLGGTASSGADYSYSFTSTGIDFIIHSDGVLDADETIIVTISGFNSNTVEFGTLLSHTVTISDVPFVLEFASSSSSILEGSSGTAMFALGLPEGVTPSISFGGSATAGIDYTYSIIPGGIEIATLEEWVYDPDETIIITLLGATGNTELGSTVSHTVTITDPLGQVVEFALGSSTLAEGQNSIIAYTTSLPAGVMPTVSVGGTATAGEDFTYSLLPSGIMITVNSDGDLDPDETVILTLTGFNSNDVEFGTTVTHTLTITDVPFVVEFVTASSSVLEATNSLLAFNTVLPAGVVPSVTVGGTATLGTDYTYTITSSGINITVFEEWQYDPDETIEFTLTGVSGNAIIGAANVHTVTITDPPAPIIEFTTSSSSVTEGQNITIPFNATLPAGVTPTISLGGTAINDTDYYYTFTSNGIFIIANGDGQFDPDETIIITLTGFTTNNAAELGTSLVHTVTITDTPIVIEFLSSGVNRIEGQSAIAAFNISLPAGVVPTYSISGTATQGVDYTITQGANSFIITTLKDEIYDPNETIIIELLGLTGNAVLGAKKVYTLTLQDEDETATPRLVINLTWDSGNGTAGDVDMDILVWYETSPGTYRLELLADNVGPKFESISIPSTLQNGKWGLSYVYYSGTSDNLSVSVSLRSYKGNINGTSNRALYNFTYTLANINPWDQTQNFTREQFYDKLGNNYNNVTGITVPSSGSRVRPSTSVISEGAREMSKKLSQGTN